MLKEKPVTITANDPEQMRNADPISAIIVASKLNNAATNAAFAYTKQECFEARGDSPTRAAYWRDKGDYYSDVAKIYGRLLGYAGDEVFFFVQDAMKQIKAAEAAGKIYRLADEHETHNPHSL